MGDLGEAAIYLFLGSGPIDYSVAATTEVRLLYLCLNISKSSRLNTGVVMSHYGSHSLPLPLLFKSIFIPCNDISLPLEHQKQY